MAAPSTALTTKPESGSPYQLDINQITRAAESLVKHITAEQKRKEAESSTKSLLPAPGDDSDEEVAEQDEVPIWLILTTKKHITDTKRLKPGKIALPHSLHTSPTLRICLITADPQRTYKDLLAHPSFPPALAARISRVIGLTKLKAKYKSYESKRQLASEHDLFLADERVVTFLPGVLGKVFYGSTAKRPVPVSLTGNVKTAKEKDGEGKKKKKSGEGASGVVGAPQDVAKAIEKTLASALVHLSPSATTAIRVGKASWPAQHIVENVEAVVKGLLEGERWVPKGWRNVRSIHVKGPNTTSLPVWLASELWVDEGDVLDQKFVEEKREKRTLKGRGEKRKAVEEAKSEEGAVKKRGADEVDGADGEKAKRKRERKEKESDDLEKEIKLRKERLRKQKEEAMKDVDGSSKKAAKRPSGDVLDGEKSGKKVKKSKAVATA